MPVPSLQMGKLRPGENMLEENALRKSGAGSRTHGLPEGAKTGEGLVLIKSPALPTSARPLLPARTPQAPLRTPALPACVCRLLGGQRWAHAPASPLRPAKSSGQEKGILPSPPSQCPAPHGDKRHPSSRPEPRTYGHWSRLQGPGSEDRRLWGRTDPFPLALSQCGVCPPGGGAVGERLLHFSS